MGLYFAAVYSFSLLCHKISELHLPIATKLSQIMGSMFNFIIQVAKFGDTPPKNFGAKTSYICHNFGQLQTVTMNTSGMDEDIQSWKNR